ncbi:MAG: hypothetical protein C0401_10905 [Anaerolinea sp.]|nr:hypothetical protein [Anaerolinea sp.]
MSMGETHSITIRSKIISYKVRVSARARRLRITVSGEGVTVTLPKGIPQCEAERFMLEHAQWVTVQLERESNQARSSPLPADVILWHGVPTQIQRVEESGRKAHIKIEETQGRLRVYLPSGSQITTRQAVEAWMRARARAEIEKVVIEQAHRMRANPKAVSIRDQRTRWGSCSSRGALSFNWRLTMTPPTVMDYVVIHELAHLFEPNHSSNFWAVVTKFYPDFKKARTWLRKNAGALRAH